ncbi:related to RNA polymerase II mediator complex protein pmc1 [Pseudozyma flocculosa]|uniref:Mediator of RNA polymerase II transcription subunit 14 n=1 Tax=Pseudozyma flocculosa TaxID=84751 RepID=A0A5C3F0G2_9BASI|nr:related to RNA polymerase II mediator complex protein pmc1 [Pseudozyma flocculosa]
MSATQRNEPTDPNTKAHTASLNRNGSNGAHLNGLHPHHTAQQPSPRPSLQPHAAHQQPSPRDAIARIKSESLNGSQKLMMGVPPASTPDHHQASATSVNGDARSSGRDALHPPIPSVSAVDVKGKAREVDPVDDIPIAQLEQELPLEDADLVPLAALVERLANYGYETLQNLAETAKIFSTALDVRKQFLKLLVLVRWSKDIADLQKARNIISLLSEQQWQHEDVFAGLTDVRKILPNARMRNADLPTAIDVLRTGSYRRLPSSLKDMVVPPRPFSDAEAIEIVAQLEDALRLRMACREIIPAPMSRYRILDGKVHFRVPGLYETQLTASGSGAPPPGSAAAEAAAAADRWWLLDLKFDIRITGPNADAAIKLFPRKPRKVYRERLRIWGDHELEPRSAQQEQDQGTAGDEENPSKGGAGNAEGVQAKGEDAMDVDQDPAAQVDADGDGDGDQRQVSSSQGRDAPLVRLHAFLQERSLHYQMDILQYQARELMRLNWGSSLRVETSERPRALTLRYWVNAQTTRSSKQGSAASEAAKGGSLRIAIADLTGSVGKKRIVADLLDSEADVDGEDEASMVAGEGGDRQVSVSAPGGEGQTPFLVKRRHLQVTWEVDAAIKAEAGSVDLEISSQALDLERLLTELVQRHASALLRVLQKQILAGQHAVSKGLRSQDCRLCSAAVRRKDVATGVRRPPRSEYLRIDLLGSSRERQPVGMARSSGMPPLRLKIEAISGRLQLEADTEALALEGDANKEGDRQRQVALLTAFSAGALAARQSSARLNDASDRINASIDALLDSLHRLEIFARVEQWERQASYIGLRSTRRLSFRQSEYTKFGPSLATCGPPALYIPLGSRLPGFYLALQPSETTGVNVALLSTMQMVEGPGTIVTALQSIEWLDRQRLAAASDSRPVPDGAALGKRKRGGPTDWAAGGNVVLADAETGKGELTLEELANMHSYSVALICYASLEQQLRARSIAYVHVGDFTSRPRPPKAARVQRAGGAKSENSGPGVGVSGDDGQAGGESWHEDDSDAVVASMVPTLCLPAAGLFGPAKAHLVKRNVSMQICQWWDKDKVRVEISVKLRMRSRRFKSFRRDVEPSVAGMLQPGGIGQVPSSRAYLEFDGRTSILTFSTPDLHNCVAAFLTEWQRISPAIQLAREVLNVGRGEARTHGQDPTSKAPQTALELMDFDFSAVTFAYGWAKRNGTDANMDKSETKVAPPAGQRRLLVRVRWQEPSVAANKFTGLLESVPGGYQLDFGSREATSGDPEAWFSEAAAEANPHRAIGHELRRAVNAAAAALDRPLERSDRVWRGFFRLLQDTLPIVKEVQPLIQGCLEDAECPELEIKSATWFRVQFLDRYALDIRLTTNSRFLLCDASQPLFRSPSKGLDTSMPSSVNGGPDSSPTGKDVLYTLAKSAKLSEPGGQHEKDWTRLESTGQYLSIPRFSELLRSVCEGVPKSRRLPNSSTGGGGGGGEVEDLVNLRRALLCSADDAVVGVVLPALIKAIRSGLRGALSTS